MAANDNKPAYNAARSEEDILACSATEASAALLILWNA